MVIALYMSQFVVVWMMSDLKPEEFPFMYQRIYQYADFIKTQVSIFMPSVQKLYSQQIYDYELDDYNAFVYNAFFSYMVAIDEENTRLTKSLQQCAKILKQYLSEQKSIRKQIVTLEKRCAKDPKDVRTAECLAVAQNGDKQLGEYIYASLRYTLQIEKEYKQLSVKLYRSFNQQLMASNYQFDLPVKKNGRGPVEGFRGRIGEISDQSTQYEYKYAFQSVEAVNTQQGTQAQPYPTYNMQADYDYNMYDSQPAEQRDYYGE